MKPIKYLLGSAADIGLLALPSPPGPKEWPVIGNALDMPISHHWLTFGRWADTYRDLVSVTPFGQTIVIINSYTLITEMLEKKSAIYSDCRQLFVSGKLITPLHVEAPTRGRAW
ncbi:cytochrome P450 [Sparassis crispa]|uniref:Cytochrome P450 n=1 Tax=Sparassis crispa TaxID=139825 RepID=A0A401GXE4_9APHY|nr:cytochrome P450 [Sparassis crispa]GBE86444.1 cytochrome P450 [Sparassis crispa]